MDVSPERSNDRSSLPPGHFRLDCGLVVYEDLTPSSPPCSELFSLSGAESQESKSDDGVSSNITRFQWQLDPTMMILFANLVRLLDANDSLKIFLSLLLEGLVFELHIRHKKQAEQRARHETQRLQSYSRKKIKSFHFEHQTSLPGVGNPDCPAPSYLWEILSAANIPRDASWITKADLTTLRCSKACISERLSTWATERPTLCDKIIQAVDIIIATQKQAAGIWTWKPDWLKKGYPHVHRKELIDLVSHFYGLEGGRSTVSIIHASDEERGKYAMDANEYHRVVDPVEERKWQEGFRRRAKAENPPPPPKPKRGEQQVFITNELPSKDEDSPTSHTRRNPTEVDYTPIEMSASQIAEVVRKAEKAEAAERKAVREEKQRRDALSSHQATLVHAASYLLDPLIDTAKADTAKRIISRTFRRIANLQSKLDIKPDESQLDPIMKEIFEAAGQQMTHGEGVRETFESEVRDLLKREQQRVAINLGRFRNPMSHTGGPNYGLSDFSSSQANSESALTNCIPKGIAQSSGRGLWFSSPIIIEDVGETSTSPIIVEDPILTSNPPILVDDSSSDIEMIAAPASSDATSFDIFADPPADLKLPSSLIPTASSYYETLSKRRELESGNIKTPTSVPVSQFRVSSMWPSSVPHFNPQAAPFAPRHGRSEHMEPKERARGSTDDRSGQSPPVDDRRRKQLDPRSPEFCYQPELPWVQPERKNMIKEIKTLMHLCDDAGAYDEAGAYHSFLSRSNKEYFKSGRGRYPMEHSQYRVTDSDFPIPWVSPTPTQRAYATHCDDNDSPQSSPELNPQLLSNTERSTRNKKARHKIKPKNGEVVGASAPEIGAESFGRKMLEKMGWEKRQPCGKTIFVGDDVAMSEGNMVEPPKVVFRRGTAGLGSFDRA